MEFVLVEPGSFQMGSEKQADERPIHKVTISKAFSVSKFEVTKRQWRDVMSSNPSVPNIGDDCPVTNVSWNDVQEFLRRMNEKEPGVKYRLPTEAEWEYAARGGTRSEGFTFAGSDTVAKVAVVFYKSGFDVGIKPVGSKRPNELGLYDMSGNVWEWCEDYFGPYHDAAHADPKGQTRGKHRVLRGGSYYGGMDFCRTTYRTYNNPDYRDHKVGFRCVRD